MHHVIIGNGVAGMEAAILLRKRDPDATITLISAEHDHFYARTALMYILCGQLSVRDTEPYDRGLYERMRFRRVSKRVVRIAPDEHLLVFEDHGTLAYDRLLIAVGSRARPAPWPGVEGGQGIHTFVTLPDLAGLDAAARPGDDVVVVGGGLIGVEVAEVLHLRGLKVHFLIREPWYFPVALDRNESEVVAAHIRGHGVDVRTQADVSMVVRDRSGQLRGVRVGEKEIPCKLLVCAIGVVPNTEFLRGGPLPLAEGGAIETGDDLRVRGHADVWAAGDCANVTWFDGSRRPEQLWYTARDQGRAAAASMLGDPVQYRRGTWYNSAKFFDVEYTTAGYVPPPGGAVDPDRYRTWYQQVPGQAVSQRIVTRRDGATQRDGAVAGAGERVVGFNCLGSRWNHEVFLRWIQERWTLDRVLRHMDEARFDEEFSPGFRVLPTASLAEGV